MKDTTPMQLAHSRAFVDRAYAETGAFQWAREAALNAVEAGATRIHFGLDWNGVTAAGVYRRAIADNGCGMDEDELVTFFRTLGGTSKSIGGAHENYGIGAKISLLPWNTAGLVVASWKAGEGNVIWAKADAETGEYGLRKVELSDEIVEVWPTVDDPDLGFDLELLRPDWMTESGTVLLLLGDVLDQHTIRNDPRHDKVGPQQLKDYLEKRLWRIRDDVEINVDELANDHTKWPTQRSYSASQGAQTRQVRSASAVVRERATKRGIVSLPGETRVHWYLREGSESDWSSNAGFIAALYRDELYEHKLHHADYRNFGIGHADVRRNLWLIVEPKLADDDRRNGAFPEGDRNALLWNDGGGENTAVAA